MYQRAWYLESKENLGKDCVPQHNESEMKHTGVIW
jgi:hypothetical protein